MCLSCSAPIIVKHRNEHKLEILAGTEGNKAWTRFTSSGWMPWKTG